MSTKSKKGSAGAVNVHTSMRAAPACLMLGVVCVVLGVLFLLSQLWRGGSTVLEEMSRALQGLSGSLCLLLPLLLLFIGAKLLVSLGHQVSVKDVVILTALYFLILSFQTLITMITGRGSLMAYIGQINEQRVMNHPASYGAYLRRAYALGSQCGGGLFGMLLAYPLWKVLGQVGGAVLLVCAMVVLFLILVRINPAEMINQTSDRWEERKAQRAARKREMQPQQPAYETVQELPMEEMHPGQQVNHVQAEESVAPGGRYAAAEEYAFPVNNEQYNYVRQEQPQREEMTGGYGGQVFYPVSSEQIYDEPFRPVEEEMPAEQWIGEMAPVQEGPQEEMPWYDEVVPVEEMVDEPLLQEEKQPAQEKHIVRTTVQKEETKPAPVQTGTSAPKKDALAASASSWLDQLNERRRQNEMAPADGQLTEQVTSGHAKPVFTGDAVQLTGERIPIRSVAKREFVEDEKPAKGMRLDGTARDPHERVIGAPVLINYQAPPIRFLKESAAVSRQDHSQEDHERAEQIEGTLKSFNIPAEVKQIMHGPAITRFAIQIAPGIRVGRVTSMADNLALNLATKHVRMEAPIQGTNYIGIEVPNANVTPVMIREILESEAMRNNPSPLAVALGKDIAGAPVVCDLGTMPHLLIAGSTGSGKSVCIQSIVCSLLFRASPAQVRMIMVDPKQVELNMYNGIPHLLIPVVTDMRKAAGALSWAVQEMQDRYSKIGAIGEHDLKGYNARQKPEDQLPSIVIIIDEMADLMDTCRKDVEESIRRLAALARAAGIYMVLATQRPSVDVITGVIKNNIPSRIAFAVTSGTDSRTILDMYGAEKLVGKGDMLYKPSGVAPVRVQGSFVSASESNAIADYIRKHYQADYDPNIMEQLDKSQQDTREMPDTADDGGDDGEGRLDDLLHEAIQMAIEDGQTSTSMLQRRLRIGYARAGRLVDEMEKRGIVSAQDGSKPRKTIITREQYYDMFADDEM